MTNSPSQWYDFRYENGPENGWHSARRHIDTIRAVIPRIQSLHLGLLVRARVTRGIDHPSTWQASFNAADLGKHPTRDAAMQCIEARVLTHMRPTLGDQ